MSVRELVSIPGFTDPFSSLSHLIGGGVALLASVPLIRRAIDSGRTGGGIAALVIFSFSAVFLLAMSGTYHLLDLDNRARAVMQRMDHAAIFVLIAGTFTPIHAILFRGVLRWGMLGFIWTLAVLGVTLKSVYFMETPPTLGIALYLGMGWVGAISMVAVVKVHGWRAATPLVLGGIVYTFGAALEFLEPGAVVRGVVRAHELFHLAVLGGLFYHWRFIWHIAGAERVEGAMPIIRVGRRAALGNVGGAGGAIEPKPVTLSEIDAADRVSARR